MNHKTWVEISRGNLRSNIEKIKSIIGNGVDLLAVIKGNAYGAGIQNIVSATKEHVDWFGVDTIEEANLARNFCINPILIMGYVDPLDAAIVIQNKYRVLVYTYKLALALSNQASRENPSIIHLKVDTGLARLGLWPEDLIKFVKRINTLPHIEIEGLYTHFPRLVDENNIDVFGESLAKYNLVLNSLKNIGISPKILHTASSPSAILYKETYFDMVRIGISLYGLWGKDNLLEFIDSKNDQINLSPVISWKTTVINIKKVKANTGIGYGHSEKVNKDSSVAILGAGFYDGIDKRYGKVGYVLIRGKRAKILGGVAMNMCIVDITGINRVKIGDIAVIIGKFDDEEITAYEMAKIINTNCYEIISRINPLIPRVLVK